MKILPHLKAKSIMSTTSYNFSFTWCKKKTNIKKHKFIFNEPQKGLTISLNSRINVLSISMSASTSVKKPIKYRSPVNFVYICLETNHSLYFYFYSVRREQKVNVYCKIFFKKVTKYGQARHVTTKRHFDIHTHFNKKGINVYNKLS